MEDGWTPTPTKLNLRNKRRQRPGEADTAAKAPRQMKRDKGAGTKWWTHPPTTRLTHLCCIENPDNQLFRENWGYSLWRIAAASNQHDTLSSCDFRISKQCVDWHQAMPALFVNCVDQKKLSAGRSQVPSWHMFGSSEKWKHHKQSLQSVVWRKVEEWL